MKNFILSLTICIILSCAAIRAQVTGSSVVNVNVQPGPSHGELLKNCLVNGTTPNCAIPAGWTLVLADGFDSGAFGSASEYGLGGPPNSNLEEINGTNPHTGGKSIHCVVNFDASGCNVGIVQGTIGSSNHIYLSFWRWMDSNACGDTEIYFSELYTHRSVGGFDQVMDTQNNFPPCSGVMYTVLIPDGIPAVGSNCCPGNAYGNNWNLPRGSWEQVEFEYRGSTCNGLHSNNDGFFNLWVNGVLLTTHGPANLNGCSNTRPTSSAGMAVVAGGTFTYNGSVGCRPPSPPPACSPKNGAFNVYIDDLVLLKQ